MKRMLQRIIAPVLTLCLLCAFLSVAAYALPVSCGENVFQSYDPDTDTYTFYGSGPMFDFDPDPNASAQTYSCVVIEAGVTYVGAYLFEDAAIGELVLPDAPITINVDAFSGSTIERVVFPQTATDATQYNMDDFGGPQIFQVDLGGLDGFPSGFQFEFGDNYVLQSLIVGANTTTIPDNACNCFGALESLTLPDGLLEIGAGAFESCEMLHSVRIPDSVTTIGDYAFDYCVNLENVILPSHLATIGEWAFCCCGNLTAITIPDGVTTVGNSAFEGCEKLTKVTIPNSVTTIGENAFSGTGLQSVHLPAGIETIYATSFGDSLSYVCCDTADCPAVKRFAEEAGVAFRLCDGHSVCVRIAGDADGDGELTLRDTVLIRRYLAGGWDVTIDEDAADVDGDGDVTLQDVTLMNRYLAGGWDVTLY